MKVNREDRSNKEGLERGGEHTEQGGIKKGGSEHKGEERRKEVNSERVNSESTSLIRVQSKNMFK